MNLQMAVMLPLVFPRPWFLFLFLLRLLPRSAVGWPLPTVQLVFSSGGVEPHPNMTWGSTVLFQPRP